MSIPVLIEVYDETRRLAIAGSAVAPGDFRLKKLIPPLEKSGEKAPVFAKVAQAVKAVVDGNSDTAANALLELTTLVNAILYTQGETGIAGEWAPLETTDLGQESTQAGARILKPLLEALSSTGSGRLEVIRDAFERGAFKDLRLVKPALNAIDDPYSEIAELVVEKILPLYGKAILPELRGKIDVKGRGGHVHRLVLMNRLDAAGTRDIVQSALNDGSKEMKVAAIECMGTGPEDVVFLMEQARSRARDVRAAALRALASMKASTPEILAVLKKAIEGIDIELVIDKVNQCPIPEVQSFVLEQAEKQLGELLKSKDKKEQEAGAVRLQQLIVCLENRTDAGAEAFVLKCFENMAALRAKASGADQNELIAQAMSRGTPKMQQKLIATHKTLVGEGMLSHAIIAARAAMTPAEFFNEFSPSLKGYTQKRTKKAGSDAQRAEILLGVVSMTEDHRYFYGRWSGGRNYGHSTVTLKELDPQWLDVAIEVEANELVCELARPGHAGAQQFLKAQFDRQKDINEGVQLLRTMARIGHPEAGNSVIDAIKKRAKESTYYYGAYWYGPIIADLPAGEYPKFEALLPTLPDKMVDQLMDSILALKNKSE